MDKSTTFTLRGRNLKLDNSSDMNRYLDEIEDMRLVEEVQLSGNTVGVGAAKALGDAFRKMSALKFADLGNMFTGRLIDEIPAALTAICGALRYIHTFRKLDLNGNAVGAHADCLAPLLIHNRSIRFLNLDNQGLGPGGGSVIAKALADAAELNKASGMRSNLRTLICGRNRLENRSALVWGEALALHDGLVDIDMRQNGIRGAGFQAISKGLSRCTSLRHLNLDDNLGSNDTTDDCPAVDGWPAFEDALRGWSELVFLDIGNCCLGNAPFIRLLDVFVAGKHIKMQTLVLDGSDLDESVYERLSEVVASSLPSLRVLSLVDNDDLESEHLKELARVLRERGGELILDDDIDRRWPVPDDDAEETKEETSAEETKEETSAEVVKGEEEASEDDALAAKLASLDISSA